MVLLLAPPTPTLKLGRVDPLSDVLRVLRLSGAVQFRADLGSPWCFSIPHSSEMAGVFLPKVARLLRFHIVAEGQCLILIDGQRIRLTAGQVVLLPHGDPHLMCSAPDVQPVPVLSVLPRFQEDAPPRHFSRAGDEPRTTLLCGFLGCDEPIFDPLISALPLAIVEQASSGSWLDGMLQHVIENQDAVLIPGERGMTTRLVELMFVEVIRRHIARLPPDETSWLAGLRDPYVGRAVAELHSDPGRAWTVDALAKRVGLSRSMLAQRFRDVAGLSPMRYLTSWRLQVACNLFRRGDLSIAEAAARVGYQSEAAFHRAFKRQVGQSPAAWRKRACDPN